MRLSNVAGHRLGKMLDQHKNKGNPLPYLRNLNVQWLDFNLPDVLEMRFEDDEVSLFKVEPGDVMICEGGEPGRTAIWDGRLPVIMFQKALHRVRPSIALHNKFLVYRLLTDAQSSKLKAYFTGATIKHFTGQALARYTFPVPPVNEQHRIVAKVDHLMALCDKLIAQLKQSQTDSEQLMDVMVQNVLAA